MEIRRLWVAIATTRVKAQRGYGLAQARLWSQQGSKLVGTGNTGAAVQGISVAISADGNTAIMGGAYDNSSKVRRGSGLAPARLGASKE